MVLTFALDGEKTFSRTLYALGIVGSSSDSPIVSSYNRITWKSVGILVRDSRFNFSSMISVTVGIEFRHLIVIGSKFKMGL